MCQRWLAVLAVWLAVIGVIFALELASTQAPPRHAEHRGQAHAEDRVSKAESQNGETFWQRTVSDPNAFFALCVAIFTAVLALSSAGLWVATLRISARQLADMQRLLDAANANAAGAHAQADAVRQLRNAAEAQARALQSQSRAMVALAEAAAQSADTADRALTELERPFLVVDVPEPGVRVDVNGDFSFAGGPQPRWEAVNYGRTPALLVDRLTLWMHEADGTMPYAINPVTQRGPQFPAGCVAAAGHPFTETHNFLADLPNAQAFIAPGAWQTRRLFFIGYVRYADLLGSVYINGFCLRFDHLGRRFVRTGADSYNYTRAEKTANTEAA